jgi:hypothetical protein
VGPETFLPLTSVLATIAGVALMFWRSGSRLVMRMIGSWFRPRGSSRVPNPHFTTPQPERVETSTNASGQ